jgi:hypothetical protein
MKNSKYILILIPILIFFLFTGCKKPDPIVIKEAIVIPLFNATITVEDSLNFPNFSYSDTLYLVNEAYKTNDSTLNFDGFILDDIELKLYIENSFPVETYLQFYFLNSDGVIVDSLFEVQKLHIDNKNISEFYVRMNEQKYRRIVNSETIKAQINLKKTNSYLPSYRIFIGCGVKAVIEKKIY